jgi:RNA polymerase sigma-70 factor (ECF subfamily)
LTFDEFVSKARPRLRRALVGAVGYDRVDDAVAEALAWSYEHWDEVRAMDNPYGFLFRVGQSKVRSRRRAYPLVRETWRVPHVEPGLVPALQRLSTPQRTAVWLAHGCDWSHREIAAALDVSPSTVATHISRALAYLRNDLGVDHDTNT